MVYLTSIAPSENRFRHYLIEREKNLVNVKWGRKGFQQSKLHKFTDEQVAVEWLKGQVRAKVTKGYNLGNYNQLALF